MGTLIDCRAMKAAVLGVALVLVTACASGSPLAVPDRYPNARAVPVPLASSSSTASVRCGLARVSCSRRKRNQPIAG